MILSGSAKLAGVLGWPVAHSRSPRLHGFWLERHGIDGAYLPLPVRPDRFADAVRALRDLGFRGGNVTIPHKEAAFAVCDRVSRRAERAGAVNTLIFDADGAIIGDNTDGWGFLESLRAALPDFTFVGRTAVLLGAGGRRARSPLRCSTRARRLPSSTERPSGPRRWPRRSAARSQRMPATRRALSFPLPIC